MLYILVIFTCLTTQTDLEQCPVEATNVMDVTLEHCQQEISKLQPTLASYQLAQCVELDLE